MSVLTWLRKSMGKRGSSALSAGLTVVTELYQPSAHSIQEVIQEQQEAIKPLPSPEDKDFGGKTKEKTPQKRGLSKNSKN